MITIKKILVPTDFSNVSVPAIGYAISLAKDYDAEVSILHALPTDVMKEHFSGLAGGLVSPTEPPTGITRPPDLENLFSTKRQLLHNFLEKKIASELLGTVKINALIRVGKVVEEIVAAAK